MPPRTLAIVGSLSYSKPERVLAYIAALPAGTTVLVADEDSGVPLFAREASMNRDDLTTVCMHPDYTAFPVDADVVRDADMIARAQEVVIFGKGKAADRATLHAVTAGTPLFRK